MRKYGKFTILGAALTIAALTTSCGTKKAVTNDGADIRNTTTTVAGNSHGKNAKSERAMETAKMDFLRKVTDNAAYARNIVSKIKFTMNTGSKDISVAGSLHMRKDEVIRIQLTPFGIMEAGRLEFTKDYVLLVDRIHKEYVKTTYDSVDFLQRNGLDFYALQALFWNQLFVPGTQKTTDSSLKNFNVTLNTGASNGNHVALAYNKMSYEWTADPNTALINSVKANYNANKSDAASVTCRYSNFKALGSKKFPTDILLTMSTKAVRNANKMSLRLQLNSLDTDDKWEAKTTVSSKYKQVSVEDIMNQLSGL